VHDEAIFRCIQASCARSLPRRVNYCPYCGTAQQAAGPVHAGTHAGPAGAAPDRPPAGIRIHPAAPPSARPPQPDPAPAAIAPEWGEAGGAARPNPSGAAAAPRAGTGPAASRPASKSAAPPAAPPAAAPGVTQREPIRLRWWLLALAGLWLVWFMAKPSSKKLDTRIDHAIALAVECKSREAQSELIALRATRATQEQLQRVQDALNSAAAECRRQRQRNKSVGDSGRPDGALAGAADGVARPAPGPRRQLATRDHRLATEEP
jgi:hypothetical protein